jgi:hypothetical protein
MASSEAVKIAKPACVGWNCTDFSAGGSVNDVCGISVSPASALMVQ